MAHYSAEFWTVYSVLHMEYTEVQKNGILGVLYQRNSINTLDIAALKYSAENLKFILKPVKAISLKTFYLTTPRCYRRLHKLVVNASAENLT
jgi:hypothetical protein